MPSVNITVKWPNGELNDYYSPSTIVYEFFQAGQQLAATDFLSQSEQALSAASERVRARYGFACSSAMDSLGKIKYQAKHLNVLQDDVIEIVDIYNID